MFSLPPPSRRVLTPRPCLNPPSEAAACKGLESQNERSMYFIPVMLRLRQSTEERNKTGTLH